MWSKTRQILESRLAENLKGRVSYHYDVYRTKGCKEKHDWWTEMHVLSIVVDGEAWFCTNPQFYRQFVRDGVYRFEEKSDNEIIRETGLVAGGFWETRAMGYIHEYLTELSIDQAINNDNYFIRLLAVLDSRLGKRRVKALVDNIENEPEWFRKWILLRNGCTNANASTDKG